MQDAKNDASENNSNVLNGNTNETGTVTLTQNSLNDISKWLLIDINDWSVSTYQKPYKRRLGGSMLSSNCWQKLWLTFRWCKADKKDGRAYRLLDRGNREEPYTFKMLEGIGFKLFTHEPTTGEQYQMSFVNGHCGGSLDAIGILPTSYGVDTPMLISVKTAGAGARFKGIIDDGVKVKAPDYFDQECFYGYGYNIEYAAWVITGKNDDSMHIEIQKLDLKRGEELVKKAETIILSQVPMEKVSKSPAYVDCAQCTFKGVCHKKEPIDKNCRSCKSASPSPNTGPDGKPGWYCDIHQALIPEHVLTAGCDDWKPIINGE